LNFSKRFSDVHFFVICYLFRSPLAAHSGYSSWSRFKPTCETNKNFYTM